MFVLAILGTFVAIWMRRRNLERFLVGEESEMDTRMPQEAATSLRDHLIVMLIVAVAIVLRAMFLY